MGSCGPEAYERVRHGADARLPDNLKDLQREATDKARFTDAIQDGVERFLESAPEVFTLEQVAYSLGLIDYPGDSAKITALDQQRIGGALRHCGYQKTRKRVDGRLRNVYSKV